MNNFWVGLVLLGLFCIPALAQDVPKVEVYGGYQLFHYPADNCCDGYNLQGYLASIEGKVKPFLGIVGEFGYNRKTWDYAEWNEKENFSSFLFGPRFGYRAGKVRVFGHYLLGAIRYSYSDSFSDGATDTGSDSNFGQAIGGGFDITLNKRISVRPAQIDLVSIRWSDSGSSAWTNAFRYSGGIVIKLGSK